MGTLLVLYVASGLILVLVSLPLLWGKVPPNPLYGFRVRATLQNPSLWYPVNRFAAKRLLWVGVIMTVAALILYTVPGLTVDSYSLACLGILLVALGTALIQCFRYLSSITRSGGTH